jgi:outer membrane lipoprotein-sorting protein
MNHLRIKGATVLAVIGLVAANLCGGEPKTADEILVFSATKQAGYKTWSADMTQTVKNVLGAEMTITGRMIYKQPHLMRMEMEMPMMGQPGKMLMIIGADKIAWQQMDVAGQTSATKIDMSKVAGRAGARPLDAMEPQKFLQSQKEMFEFSLVGKDNLHGQSMYVLEGTWKSSALTNQQLAALAAVVGKSGMYIGQQDGFLHRVEQFDTANSTRIMSLEFTNLKFNQDVPDETFVYQPPAGVPVVDMTQSVGQTMGTAPEPPPATPVPAR